MDIKQKKTNRRKIDRKLQKQISKRTNLKNRNLPDENYTERDQWRQNSG